MYVQKDGAWEPKEGAPARRKKKGRRRRPEQSHTVSSSEEDDDTYSDDEEIQVRGNTGNNSSAPGVSRGETSAEVQGASCQSSPTKPSGKARGAAPVADESGKQQKSQGTGETSNKRKGKAGRQSGKRKHVATDAEAEEKGESQDAGMLSE